MRDMAATVVYNGEQALSLVDEEEPEVIVLDLKMPGIDGFEVLRRIKKEHPKVEIIVLTGQSSKEDEEACLKLGAFAYLEKPVDVEVLAQIMRKAYQKVRE
jgi:CheY-like chemotaxis protein